MSGRVDRQRVGLAPTSMVAVTWRVAPAMADTVSLLPDRYTVSVVGSTAMPAGETPMSIVPTTLSLRHR